MGCNPIVFSDSSLTSVSVNAVLGVNAPLLKSLKQQNSWIKKTQ